MKQEKENKKGKQTTFTDDEYNQLTLDLEFINSSLDVIVALTSSVEYEWDGPNFHPVICETLSKIVDARKLINSMSPVFPSEKEAISH